jgi:uncharacterized protein
VLVPTFVVTGRGGKSWRPIFLTNHEGSTYHATTVIDAIMATTAAPCYFPSFGRYIDGGVVENNPSVSAAVFAYGRGGGQRSPRRMRMVSLGTGYRPQSITEDTTNWGEIQWLLFPEPKVPLASALTSAQSQASSIYAQRLLGDGYLRLNPVLRRGVPLDAYKQIPALIAVADAFPLEPAYAWLRREWLP